jgi:hypothetical protein
MACWICVRSVSLRVSRSASIRRISSRTRLTCSSGGAAWARAQGWMSVAACRVGQQLLGVGLQLGQVGRVGLGIVGEVVHVPAREVVADEAAGLGCGGRIGGEFGAGVATAGRPGGRGRGWGAGGQRRARRLGSWRGSQLSLFNLTDPTIAVGGRVQESDP